MIADGFKFHDPGILIDGELELILFDKIPGNPKINWLPAYRFKMIETARGIEMGTVELRVGYSHNIVMFGGHFAYAVSPDHRGHHYAARSCRLLFPLARAHGMQILWITCNPDNYASRKTCEALGASLVEIIDLPEDNDMYQEGERQKCRYRLEI